MSMSVEKLEEILDMLRDGKWHSISEISSIFHIDEWKLHEVLRFFMNFGLVEYDEAGKRVKITNIGLSFLKLPVERREE